MAETQYVSELHSPRFGTYSMCYPNMQNEYLCHIAHLFTEEVIRRAHLCFSNVLQVRLKNMPWSRDPYIKDMNCAHEHRAKV